jgi:hypothetical protein
MTGTFDDIVVPSGGNCKLITSEVRGSVRVLAGGSLEVLGTTVRGDVRAETGNLSLGIGGIATGNGIQSSFIGGSVIAKGTLATLPSYGVNYLCNTRVEHEVWIGGSSAAAPWDIGFIPFPCTFGNSIGGSVTLVQNQARVRVANNTPGHSPSSLLTPGGIAGYVNFFSNASVVGPHLIADNTVGESVLVFLNQGGVAITANTIEDSLLCRRNTPPAVAAGNTVGGYENCEKP